MRRFERLQRLGDRTGLDLHLGLVRREAAQMQRESGR